MRLGFTLRRVVINISEIVRRLLDMSLYFTWLLLDPSKFKTIDNKRIKSILVVDTGAMGDTYNVLAIINQLLKKYPYLNIYYLTNEKKRKFVKNPKICAINKEKAISLIDNKNIDAIIFLTNIRDKELFDKSFYFKALKIPYRVFSDYASVSTLFKQLPLLVTRKVFPTYKTMLEDSISAFEILGFSFDKKIGFYHPPDAEKFADKFIKNLKDNKKQKIIFIHASCEKVTHALNEGKVPSSDWPTERWVEVTNTLLTNYNSKIIFTGTLEENQVIKEIISKVKYKKRIINSAGKFSIEQIASLLKRADLLISVDTSIDHIGAQVGVPLVVLMFCKPSFCGAHTDFKLDLFHPEVCTNCRRYSCPEKNNVCMKAITVDEVLKAASKFLDKK